MRPGSLPGAPLSVDIHCNEPLVLLSGSILYIRKRSSLNEPARLQPGGNRI